LNLQSGWLAAQSAKLLPRRGEFVQFQDPLTETIITRLTAPASAAYLPQPENRFVSTKDKFLVISSNRGGTFAPHQVDLRTGVVRQLTEAAKLDPKSLFLDAGERNLLFLDGGDLRAYSFANKRVRTLTQGVDTFTAAGDFRADGKTAGGNLVVLREGKPQNLQGDVIVPDVFSRCLCSPEGSTVLLVRGTGKDVEFSTVRAQTAGPVKRLISGAISYPFWTADSQAVAYLRDFEIRQVSVADGKDDLVAKTTMFASFSPNRDASVFIGASRSKAQPSIVLMIRSGRSELLLCGHRATDPVAVSPVFSPDSRRVYYQSDWQGNSAIFSVNTETLVEQT
jgi:oligogalacturonide lyase